ncbi:unnamed protein product [Porites evermanni]|uniref:Uncharacterized protein n=1 Tax=Porites evermanni TaxID=104178 RepID=A0ABN8PBN1_9CNID|nr:unnamed protein product [Porites evermanni]
MKTFPKCDPCLINELQSRQSKSTKVSQVKRGNQVFTSPGDIAQAFNNHFTNIGQSLAQEIPSSEIDPLAYVNPCINNLAPVYLCNLFAPRTPNYYFRNAKKKLMLPKPRTDYLKRSFSYSGALLWNNLPEEIRTSNSLGFSVKRSSHTVVF